MVFNEENLTNAPFKCTNLLLVISLLCDTTKIRWCFEVVGGNHHISAISELLLTPRVLFKWPLSENSPTVRKDHPDWPRTDSLCRNAGKASCLSAPLILILILFSEGCYRDECSCSLRKLLQVLGRYCIMPTFGTSLGYLKSPLATTHGNAGLQTL